MYGVYNNIQMICLSLHLESISIQKSFICENGIKTGWINIAVLEARKCCYYSNKISNDFSLGLGFIITRTIFVWERYPNGLNQHYNAKDSKVRQNTATITIDPNFHDLEQYINNDRFKRLHHLLVLLITFPNKLESSQSPETTISQSLTLISS